MKDPEFEEETPTPELRLPIHEATRFVLVHPHYPENVGAAARAIKTMGFTRLALVRPSRIAVPEHAMARKMAVKSKDVLDAARRYETLAQALTERDMVVGTTSRRGVSGVLSPRELAQRAVAHAATGGRLCILFGNEKTGLTSDQLALADLRVRIPMAGAQPSINLAQATQLIAYELLVEALAARAR